MKNSGFVGLASAGSRRERGERASPAGLSRAALPGTARRAAAEEYTHFPCAHIPISRRVDFF